MDWGLRGPSAGYLVGFPIAAFVTGWLIERKGALFVLGTGWLPSSSAASSSSTPSASP